MAEIAQASPRLVDRMMVRIEHLDRLLGLAGEVIITSSSLHELQRTLQESFSRNRPITKPDLDTVNASDEAARRISQDLHNLVMDIRLVEIAETFRIFRRPIRDLARRLGREIDLVFEGGETLIDKALAERLTDPLLHLLRNAVDHGIEVPLERSRLGKEVKGSVTVFARDREHHTEISVRDDGRGIERTAIIRRAEELGLNGRGEERTLFELLAHTGFSTSKGITDTSGRGVGLDIVRNAMAELGGEVALDTTPGEGSVFTLTIPKLRAVNIVDALTVRAGGGLYAFPIESIVSFLGIEPSKIETALGRERYITYLGEVIVLANLLGLIGGEPSSEEFSPLPVAIIEGGAGKVALIVSEFLGPQKLVNVPLNEKVFKVRGMMGTSVFAGGSIGLTLDPDEITAMALGECRGEAATAPNELIPALEEERPPAEGSDLSQRPGRALSLSPEVAGLNGEDVSDLLEELRRSLTELQDALLSLEASQGSREHLDHAFRLLHAAKGNFTMLEQPDAAGVAHLLETILDFLRGERLSMTPARTDALLDGVTFLLEHARALPGTTLPIPRRLLETLALEARPDEAERTILSDQELVGQAFSLSPTVELQVLSAIKRGERTFETFLSFESGRQADFMVAYLILRRLGLSGNVLATLPAVDSIEKGECGTAIKVLWSTALGDEEREGVMENLSVLYGLREHISTPVALFQYSARAPQRE